MDQPTARRRRHAGSANSVTVAELQAKSTAPERASLSAVEARAAAEAVSQPHGRPPASPPWRGWTPAIFDRAGQTQRQATADLVRYEVTPAGLGATNRLRRTVMTTLVVLATFAGVLAVAAIIGGRPHRLSPSAPIVQPAVTAGPAVVRPEAMINQLVTGTLGRIPPEPIGGAGGAGGGIDGQQGPLADRTEAQQVVMQFYGALPVHTDEAYRLLGPTMRGNDWAEFNAGWRGTRSVEARVLRANEQDGGLLRVAVSVEQFDSSVLQLTQRVEVRRIPVEGGQPELRIVGVELLSAHRG